MKIKQSERNLPRSAGSLNGRVLYIFLLFLILASGNLNAQINLQSNGPGNTYEDIDAQFGGGASSEVPDCSHTSFGRHISEVFDNTLNKNVFVFHIHADIDNDRCTNFDRQRNEIKGGSGAPSGLQHTQGQTAYMRWKFKLDAGFIPSGRFTHIMQIKAFGGDAGAPLVTLTPRAGSPQKMEVIHSSGGGSGSLGKIAEVDLAPFKGTWVEAYMEFKSSEGSGGTFILTVKRISDGATLLSVSRTGIDMWRTDASFNRPKWGIYRGLDPVLRDEQVRFADFCISESSASQCPSSIGAGTPPAAPSNLTGTSVSSTQINLSWSDDSNNENGFRIERSTDSGSTWSFLTNTSANTTSHQNTGLTPSTTYHYRVRAENANGNSVFSNTANATTDANVGPSVSITSPSDGASFTAPASITINASASDSDGTVSKVEFFQGTTKLGEDVSSPYSFTWSNVSAGNYSLTARATDNHNGVTTSSAVSIIVNSAPVGLPAPWLNQDIGSVAATGSATYSSGTFTVKASGADIWGTADEFHYVYQQLNGDAEITARVGSLTNTNAWAKAGVMIRESLASNSTHAMVIVTPGTNGVSFQRRVTTGGTSASTAATGAIPVWLKMKRTGSTFTSSSSTDGVTWTTIGTVSIAMAANVHVGLALTSHADGTIATGTFSNVSVTDPSCVPAIASADDGNVAANVLDNDFNTRWSASGDPQWIQFCLGSTSSVSGVQIAFYKGNERTSRFDVQVSINGTTFTNAATNLVSSGTSLALESFSFPAQSATYVRTVGHGNSINLWNSYTEVRISNSSSSARSGIAKQESISEETSSHQEFSSYPNPAKDKITIAYTVEKRGRVKLSIDNVINSYSNPLLDKELPAGTYQNSFDINHLPTGFYVIKMINNGKISINKLIKK